MNCIYCDNTLSTSYVSIRETYVTNCRDCDTTYIIENDEITCVSISYIANNIWYILTLDILFGYTVLYKDNKKLAKYPFLVWAFPYNIKEWIDKLSNLKVFL